MPLRQECLKVRHGGIPRGASCTEKALKIPGGLSFFLMPHRESAFWLFAEVMRKIPGEVTRKSDGPANRPRAKTTGQGLRAF